MSNDLSHENPLFQQSLLAAPTLKAIAALLGGIVAIASGTNLNQIQRKRNQSKRHHL